MAWLCSAGSNEALIGNLVKNSIVSDPAMVRALLAVDRKNYCVHKASAYEDSPQPIGHNATISAPHMHAMCMEALKDHLSPGAKVLDIGSGSGYLVAAMAHAVGPDGSVFGVEHIPELAAWSIENIHKDSPRLTNWRIVQGDGRLGLSEFAPYNAIHVGAAAAHMPEALVEQLAVGGRMIIPVGPQGGNQYLMQLDKDADGRVRNQKLTGVRYVPLTDYQSQEHPSWW